MKVERPTGLSGSREVIKLWRAGAFARGHGPRLNVSESIAAPM